MGLRSCFFFWPYASSEMSLKFWILLLSSTGPKNANHGFETPLTGNNRANGGPGSAWEVIIHSADTKMIRPFRFCLYFPLEHAIALQKKAPSSKDDLILSLLKLFIRGQTIVAQASKKISFSFALLFCLALRKTSLYVGRFRHFQT